MTTANYGSVPSQRRRWTDGNQDSNPLSSKITIDWYLHSVSEDRMAAQGKMLEAILNNGAMAQAAN